jgi:hypothetical protein
MRDGFISYGVIGFAITANLVPWRGGALSPLLTANPLLEQHSQESNDSFRMTPGVVCRSIDGYEDFEELPGAALTSDEKLVLYFRPLGYKIDLASGYYRAHLVQDAQIRKRGQKAVLQQKLKILEYKPKSRTPPLRIYLRNSISLKGLAPGDYDLTVILHDKLAKTPPATQVVKFRVIGSQDTQKASKSRGSIAKPSSSGESKD